MPQYLLEREAFGGNQACNPVSPLPSHSMSTQGHLSKYGNDHSSAAQGTNENNEHI